MGVEGRVGGTEGGGRGAEPWREIGSSDALTPGTINLSFGIPRTKVEICF